MQRTTCLVLLCLLFGCPSVTLGVGLPPGTTIQLTAGATYTDALEQTHNANPASVTLTVLQAAGVSITSSPPAGKTVAGQGVYIPMKIINTGNGTDRMSLSISSANGWPVAIIYDDNADSIHEPSEQTNITSTGTTLIVPGGYCPCFAEVTVPSNATTGDTLTVTAVSVYDPVNGIAAAAMSVPPPNVTATGLSIAANPASSVVNQTVALTGQLTPAMVQSITISITNPSSVVTTSAVSTDSTGSYQTSFQPSSTGAYSIRASFAGATGYQSSSATAAVAVSNKAVTALLLTATPTNPTACQSVTVKGVFSPAGQVPLTLTFTDSAGNTSTSQVSTGLDGTFTSSKVLSTVGNWQIAASYAGSTTQQACSGTLVVPVSQPTPVQSPNAIVIVGLAAANPAAVAAGGRTACSAAASDSHGDPVVYLWSDSGAGGSFSPSPAVQNPTYTAPANATGKDISVSLTCTVASSIDPTVTAGTAATLTVHSSQTAPSVVSVQPADSAGCVDLDANVVIQFNIAMDPSSTELAVTIPPGLDTPVFSWSGDGTTLTISHANMLPGTTYTGTVGTGARELGRHEHSRALRMAVYHRPGCRVRAEPGVGKRGRYLRDASYRGQRSIPAADRHPLHRHTAGNDRGHDRREW